MAKTSCLCKEVDDIGQTAVAVRGIVNQKYKNEDVTFKVRLLVQGFEEENLRI